jgi:hypothetical protein
MSVQHLAMGSYATEFVPKFRAHRASMLATPACCKVSAVEADVFTVALCDFAQLGSLKVETIEMAKCVLANIGTNCMVVCFPEIATGRFSIRSLTTAPPTCMGPSRHSGAKIRGPWVCF